MIISILKSPITIIFLILGVLGIMVYISEIMKKNNIIELNEKKDLDLKKDIEYRLKKLMTEYETKFYYILKKLDNDKYEILPQLNLSCIVNKVNSKYRNELFRNIDFAIFAKDFKELLLLVEINDKTHNQTNRKDRDLKIKKICNDINVKLINFYTFYPNEEEYVINRIKKELDNIENKKTP